MPPPSSPVAARGHPSLLPTAGGGADAPGPPGRSLVQVLAPELPAKLPPSASGMEFSREAEGLKRALCPVSPELPSSTTISKQAQQPPASNLSRCGLSHDFVSHLLIEKNLLSLGRRLGAPGGISDARSPQLGKWDPWLQASSHGIKTNKSLLKRQEAVFSHFPVLSVPFFMFVEKERLLRANVLSNIPVERQKNT